GLWRPAGATTGHGAPTVYRVLLAFARRLPTRNGLPATDLNATSGQNAPKFARKPGRIQPATESPRRVSTDLNSRAAFPRAVRRTHRRRRGPTDHAAHGHRSCRGGQGREVPGRPKRHGVL